MVEFLFRVAWGFFFVELASCFTSRLFWALNAPPTNGVFREAWNLFDQKKEVDKHFFLNYCLLVVFISVVLLYYLTSLPGFQVFSAYFLEKYAYVFSFNISGIVGKLFPLSPLQTPNASSFHADNSNRLHQDVLFHTRLLEKHLFLPYLLSYIIRRYCLLLLYPRKK